MEENRQLGTGDYVFVQTVVVRSGRRSHWLERALGKGQVQEIPLVSRPQMRPRNLLAPPTASRGHSTDFWINILAVVALGAFLLSLFLLR